MFNQESFQEVLTAAQRLISERTDLLAAVDQVEAESAGAKQKLDDAGDRAGQEEYDAAQSGDLAIASESTKAAMADARLMMKTLQLRKSGIQKKLGKTESELAKNWRTLEDHRAEFAKDRLNELRAHADGLADQIVDYVRECYCTYRLFRDAANRYYFSPFKSFQGGKLKFQSPFAGGKILMPLKLVNGYMEAESTRELRESAAALENALAPIGEAIKAINGGSR